MSRKIVRSGVQHSVSFNPTTRNAVSPKYDIEEGEIKSVGLQKATGSTPKSIIKDDFFAEKKNHIKDKIHRINEEHIKENRQQINSQKSISDHRQKFADDAPITTQQLFGSKDVLEENTAHIDKTHIVDHFVRFSQTVSARSTAHLVNASAVTQNPSIARKPRNSATKIGKQVKVNSPSKDSGTPVEDELQAKFRRMKKKLQNVNQKLKDIQERDQ
jgi:predicted transcriptional regulator